MRRIVELALLATHQQVPGFRGVPHVHQVLLRSPWWLQLGSFQELWMEKWMDLDHCHPNKDGPTSHFV